MGQRPAINADLPLTGVTILDLSRLLPGGYCSVLLADLGCRVIKVEQPGEGDYYRSLNRAGFAEINRNKESITLNLKAAEGREVLLRLVNQADVVLESFRPGVAQRLGIDYAVVSEVNAQVVYCSLTGYGQDGPYRNMPGHDINYAATAGMLSLLGSPAGPPEFPVGISIADFSGGMFAAIAILSGLAARDRTGRGSYLDVSLTDGMASWMGRYAAEYQWRGAPTKRELMQKPGTGVFETLDGQYISVAAVEDKFWAAIIRLAPPGMLPAGAGDWSIAERNRRADQLLPYLEAVFRTRTRAEWMESCAAADIPAAPVNDLPGMLSDPHLQKRGLFETVPGAKGDWQTVLSPFMVNGQRPGVRRTAPQLGEQTDAVLTSVGYSPEALARLRAAGII